MRAYKFLYKIWFIAINNTTEVKPHRNIFNIFDIHPHISRKPFFFSNDRILGSVITNNKNIDIFIDYGSSFQISRSIGIVQFCDKLNNFKVFHRNSCFFGYLSNCSIFCNFPCFYLPFRDDKLFLFS